MCRRIGLLAVMILASAGCVNPQTRLQSAEENERDKDLEVVRTIGETTEVANAAPIHLSGVGLVTGLEGTGGSPSGIYRTMLEKQLRLQKIDRVKELLDSPNDALVLISAFIPPGARKGRQAGRAP